MREDIISQARDLTMEELNDLLEFLTSYKEKQESKINDQERIMVCCLTNSDDCNGNGRIALLDYGNSCLVDSYISSIKKQLKRHIPL